MARCVIPKTSSKNVLLNLFLRDINSFCYLLNANMTILKQNFFHFFNFTLWADNSYWVLDATQILLLIKSNIILQCSRTVGKERILQNWLRNNLWSSDSIFLWIRKRKSRHFSNFSSWEIGGIGMVYAISRTTMMSEDCLAEELLQNLEEHYSTETNGSMVYWVNISPSAERLGSCGRRGWTMTR